MTNEELNAALTNPDSLVKKDILICEEDPGVYVHPMLGSLLIEPGHKIASMQMKVESRTITPRYVPDFFGGDFSALGIKPSSEAFHTAYKEFERHPSRFNAFFEAYGLRPFAGSDPDIEFRTTSLAAKKYRFQSEALEAAYATAFVLYANEWAQRETQPAIGFKIPLLALKDLTSIIINQVYNLEEGDGFDKIYGALTLDSKFTLTQAWNLIGLYNYKEMGLAEITGLDDDFDRKQIWKVLDPDCFNVTAITEGHQILDAAFRMGVTEIQGVAAGQRAGAVNMFLGETLPNKCSLYIAENALQPKDLYLIAINPDNSEIVNVSPSINTQKEIRDMFKDLLIANNHLHIEEEEEA